MSKLTVLYDDHRDANDSDSRVSSAGDVLRRFAAYGWATKRIDGHDPAQIHAALSFAARSKKPTMIACRTIIGFGAPTKAGTGFLHNAPLGAVEAAGAKQLLDWHEPPFATPDDLKERWRAVGSRGAAARRSWLKRLARHNQRSEFERVMAGRLPDNWHETVLEMKQRIGEERVKRATTASGQQCLEALVSATPELIGGSADLSGSNLTLARGLPTISAGNYSGRYLHYGLREHGMAAVANGMALHGGIIPYIGTFFVFTDYLRPALRLCAIMRLRVIYVLTHDSVGLGEDGPAHQPVEHLASLRAMPNLFLFRPADTMETAECLELAVRRSDGPSLLLLSRQIVAPQRSEVTENRCARGGYVLVEADGPRQATLIATGSEVPIAMAAREKLAGDNIAVAVVSLPCWQLFAQQDETYQAQVLGNAPRIGIEAASGFGWERWLGPNGTFIGVNGFGASANHEDLYSYFGITPDAVIAAVYRYIG